MVEHYAGSVRVRSSSLLASTIYARCQRERIISNTIDRRALNIGAALSVLCFALYAWTAAREVMWGDGLEPRRVRDY